MNVAQLLRDGAPPSWAERKQRESCLHLVPETNLEIKQISFRVSKPGKKRQIIGSAPPSISNS